MHIIQSKRLSFYYLQGQIFQSLGTSPDCHDLSNIMERELKMTPNSSTSILGCFLSGAPKSAPMGLVLCSTGLKAPCLYPPLCLIPSHSAGKGNKCFLTLPSNIKLGEQNCEWVQKAIKQSHGIKIHQDYSTLRCWYHHVMPGSPYSKDYRTVRPHNIVTTLLFLLLCICAQSPFLLAYTEEE